MKVHIYLNFDGQCEEAFNFYKAVFKRDFQMISYFKDMPTTPETPETPNSGKVSEEHLNRVMHVSIPMGEGQLLMGSDTMHGFGPPHQKGNNFNVSINLEDKAEGERIFAALSESGKVTMPMADTFWNAYFGSLIDQFGVGWMVSVE